MTVPDDELIIAEVNKITDYAEPKTMSRQDAMAAGLYRYARPEAPIYLIDPADVTLFDKRVHHIKAVATKGMQEFVGMLK